MTSGAPPALMRMHGNNKRRTTWTPATPETPFHTQTPSLIELATLKNEPNEPVIRFTCDNTPTRPTAAQPLGPGAGHVTTLATSLIFPHPPPFPHCHKNPTLFQHPRNKLHCAPRLRWIQDSIRIPPRIPSRIPSRIPFRILLVRDGLK